MTWRDGAQKSWNRSQERKARMNRGSAKRTPPPCPLCYRPMEMTTANTVGKPLTWACEGGRAKHARQVVVEADRNRRR